LEPEFMEYIYTFVGGTPDFVWLSQREFRRRFGIKQAVGYLEQVRGTLIGEARDRRGLGCFYTGLRHAFAEIDGLGKLYKGEYGKGDTAANAVAFGTDYLGRLNSQYKHLFGLLFDMYRHGLAHGHLVRSARYLKNGKWHFVYWRITEERSDHLTLRRNTNENRVWLTVSVPQLVDDTIAAIDLLICDLNTKKPNSQLFARFRRGYAGTCVALRDPQALRAGPRKLKLNNYSNVGINWIRASV